MKSKLLAQADTLGLRALDPATPISTAEEWSTQNLMMENDHKVLRDTLLEHVERATMTVGWILCCIV